jgi:4,5-DOPA dioxygenase extradiol
MAAFRFPSLFVSHGSPMLAYGDDPAQEALARLSASLPHPKAIVCLSAHSVSRDRIQVLRAQTHSIQHDFGGFPEDLYQIRYPCQGDPALADRIVALFQEAGLPASADPSGPLDHGVWIPLLHLYPKGDVPVIRVSLPLEFQPLQVMKMGQVLSALREQGVLLLGSGGAVHNLRELRWAEKRGKGADFALRFEEWLITCLQKKDVESLVTFEENPDFFKSHPTSEHFLPLLFTVGSALPQDEFQLVHRGVEYSTLSMLSFTLNHESDHLLH